MWYDGIGFGTPITCETIVGRGDPILAHDSSEGCAGAVGGTWGMQEQDVCEDLYWKKAMRVIYMLLI